MRLDAEWHIAGSGEWEFKFGWAQIVACGLVAVFTALNCLGIQRTARVQNVLTSIKVLVLIAFIVTGFAYGNGSWHNFSQPAVRTSTTPIFAQFFVSLFYIYFAYSGWNAATYVAEELKQPARTLPLSLAFGTTLVAALFIGLNVLFIYAVPLESMKGVVAIGALAATASVRTGRGRSLQRRHGALAARNRQRDGHHRTACLLRHGQERRLLQHGRQSEPALAHPGHRDRAARASAPC